jgi:hypothetical protein
MAGLGKRKKRYPRAASGQEITPEVEEALAAEAERGYDLSKARREFVGRPPLGDSGTSPRIAFRLPQDRFNKVRERADAEDRTISSLAREALTRFMDSQ